MPPTTNTAVAGPDAAGGDAPNNNKSKLRYRVADAAPAAVRTGMAAAFRELLAGHTSNRGGTPAPSSVALEAACGEVGEETTRHRFLHDNTSNAAPTVFVPSATRPGHIMLHPAVADLLTLVREPLPSDDDTAAMATMATTAKAAPTRTTQICTGFRHNKPQYFLSGSEWLDRLDPCLVPALVTLGVLGITPTPGRFDLRLEPADADDTEEEQPPVPAPLADGALVHTVQIVFAADISSRLPASAGAESTAWSFPVGTDLHALLADLLPPSVAPPLLKLTKTFSPWPGVVNVAGPWFRAGVAADGSNAGGLLPRGIAMAVAAVEASASNRVNNNNGKPDQPRFAIADAKPLAAADERVLLARSADAIRGSTTMLGNHQDFYGPAASPVRLAYFCRQAFQANPVFLNGMQLMESMAERASQWAAAPLGGSEANHFYDMCTKWICRDAGLRECMEGGALAAPSGSAVDNMWLQPLPPTTAAKVKTTADRDRLLGKLRAKKKECAGVAASTPPVDPMVTIVDVNAAAKSGKSSPLATAAACSCFSAAYDAVILAAKDDAAVHIGIGDNNSGGNDDEGTSDIPIAIFRDFYDGKAAPGRLSRALCEHVSPNDVCDLVRLCILVPSTPTILYPRTSSRVKLDLWTTPRRRLETTLMAMDMAPDAASLSVDNARDDNAPCWSHARAAVLRRFTLTYDVAERHNADGDFKTAVAEATSKTAAASTTRQCTNPNHRHQPPLVEALKGGALRRRVTPVAPCHLLRHIATVAEMRAVVDDDGDDDTNSDNALSRTALAAWACVEGVSTFANLLVKDRNDDEAQLAVASTFLGVLMDTHHLWRPDWSGAVSTTTTTTTTSCPPFVTEALAVHAELVSRGIIRQRAAKGGRRDTISPANPPPAFTEAGIRKALLDAPRLLLAHRLEAQPLREIARDIEALQPAEDPSSADAAAAASDAKKKKHRMFDVRKWTKAQLAAEIAPFALPKAERAVVLAELQQTLTAVDGPLSSSSAASQQFIHPAVATALRRRDELHGRLYAVDGPCGDCTDDQHQQQEEVASRPAIKHGVSLDDLGGVSPQHGPETDAPPSKSPSPFSSHSPNAPPPPPPPPSVRQAPPLEGAEPALLGPATVDSAGDREDGDVPPPPAAEPLLSPLPPATAVAAAKSSTTTTTTTTTTSRQTQTTDAAGTRLRPRRLDPTDDVTHRFGASVVTAALDDAGFDTRELQIGALRAALAALSADSEPTDENVASPDPHKSARRRKGSKAATTVSPPMAGTDAPLIRHFHNGSADDVVDRGSRQRSPEQQQQQHQQQPASFSATAGGSCTDACLRPQWMQRADEAFAAHWSMHRHHGHDMHGHGHTTTLPGPPPSAEVLEQVQEIRDEARATAHESGIAMIEPCAWGTDDDDDDDGSGDGDPAPAVGAW